MANQSNSATQTPRDRGCDPVGDGTFRMVPSGDIVNLEERNRRLDASRRAAPQNDCLGMSWDQIDSMQGGRLVRDL